MDELVRSQLPALHSLERKSLLLNVASSIGDYLNFVGLGRKMNDRQIAETAEMMIDSHPHLKVDAIKTFFYNCKRGTYGYHYDEINGTRILMWFDKFVEDYYKAIDDYEYAKHESTKGELAKPIENEDGQAMTYEEYYAIFHKDEKEQAERNSKVKDIRLAVQKKCMHLYNEMSVEEADKIVEQEIINEMKNQGLINF